MKLLSKQRTSEFELLKGNIESLFVEEFISLWKVIRKYQPREIIDVKKACSLLFKDHTKLFIERWNDQVSIITTSREYIRDYYSFELIVRSGIHILIPHKILVYESMRSEGQNYQAIDKIETLRELLFFVERSCRETNFRLNRNDVLILRKLVSNKFMGQSKRVPKLEDLAEYCGYHKNTITSHISKLTDSYTLSIIYKVDPSIIGYETVVIIGKKESSSDEYKKYYLGTNPFSCSNFFDKNIHRCQLVISQIPIYKHQVYHSMKNNPNTLLFEPLEYEYTGWNLYGLTPDIINRWRKLPPILSVFSWDEEIRSRNVGINLILKPNQEIPHLTPLDKKILDMYATHNMIEDVEVARKLNVTDKYIRESRHRLLKKKLLKLFVNVSNIGTICKPWITIIGHKSDTHKTLVRNIFEHLKFFPFVRLFYSLENSRPFLTGYLYIPESWVTDFLYKWSELEEYGLIAELNQCYSRTMKWNINIKDTC